MSKNLDALSLFSQETENELIEQKKSEPIPADKEAIAYWNRCLEIIKDNVRIQAYNTWFAPIEALKWDDGELSVKVPSQFFIEWIEDHYYNLVQKTIYEVCGEGTKLQYKIIFDEDTENRAIELPGIRSSASRGIAALANGDAEAQKFQSFLNSRYNFDNFIRGESNQLACSAGLAIGQNPGGTRFNPLVVYGDTGLGKTHLVQAIGNFIRQNDPRSKVLYTTSERFTMEFINAIQNNKVSEFIGFYRSIDVLIVDDIQFFGGKEKTQDNFFHTFNALHQAGKQLILTSDKPPRDLQDVDERLISRFQWGLIVDIQPPDLEMRMAILQKKSEDEGIQIPLDIVEFIARNVSSSIRELEGTLISLIAKVTLDGKELSLDLAREVVLGVAKIEPRQLTIDDIKEDVSKYFKIPIDVIESKSRKHEIALARQVSMFLAKRLTQSSLKTIGSHFGGRDHSTVLHSVQTVENYLVTDPNVKNAVETLRKKLKGV